MMEEKRISIRNFRSGNPTPPRLFDVVQKGDSPIYLAVKTSKNKLETILVEDVLAQIKALKDAR